jgi:hypothetical protein
MHVAAAETQRSGELACRMLHTTCILAVSPPECPECARDVHIPQLPYTMEFGIHPSTNQGKGCVMDNPNINGTVIDVQCEHYGTINNEHALTGMQQAFPTTAHRVHQHALVVER